MLMSARMRSWTSAQAISIQARVELFAYTKCIFALDIAHDLIDHMSFGWLEDCLLGQIDEQGQRKDVT